MSGIEFVLALLAGVVMGAPSTASCSRSSSMRGSTDCDGMGDEHRDAAPERRRADVYSSARIGAAAPLTLVLVVLLVLDVAVPDYDINPGILLPLLGAIRALLGLEAWRCPKRLKYGAPDRCWTRANSLSHAHRRTR